MIDSHHLSLLLKSQDYLLDLQLHNYHSGFIPVRAPSLMTNQTLLPVLSKYWSQG